MKKFKNHQRPIRKYRFDIVGHNKALKIWWDSPFNIVKKHNFVLRIAFLVFKLRSAFAAQQLGDNIVNQYGMFEPGFNPC
jgi:hypothetical protein